MGYVNKFNRGIARVQKELVENGNGKAVFTVDKVTVFSVNVTNAKAVNVSSEMGQNSKGKVSVISDKSLKVLALCVDDPHTKKEMLIAVGVTNQTANVRSIINPLILSGYLAPMEDDKSKLRNVRFEATVLGKRYLSLLKTSSEVENKADDLGRQNDQELLLFPEFE